jgi:hypothetical protein
VTGQVLWQQGADTPQTSGSVTKILTTAAARLTLPMVQRVATTVVCGLVPGQLVLVGGDPTLTAEPRPSPRWTERLAPFGSTNSLRSGPPPYPTRSCECGDPQHRKLWRR